MNSDIPGNVIAQVSQNVYDSATGAAICVMAKPSSLVR
ncbi:hypothetical protein [Vibrio alginolyticus]|nr:hypothetical protein [Vibrio alginolyticus]